MIFLMYYLLILLALQKNDAQDTPELVRAIKEGNHDAFKTFFELHHTFLYRFLTNRGLTSQQAEDLVQQAFVFIWEKRDEIDPQKSLRSYLFRIAYTRMLNHFRDHAKFADGANIDQQTEASETSDVLENEELGRAIESAIGSMPEKRQTVFRLCFIQEFTYRDAAEVLGITVKTVENHMGLALKELRNKLEAFRT